MWEAFSVFVHADFRALSRSNPSPPEKPEDPPVEHEVRVFLKDPVGLHQPHADHKVGVSIKENGDILFLPASWWILSLLPSISSFLTHCPHTSFYSVSLSLSRYIIALWVFPPLMTGKSLGLQRFAAKLRARTKGAEPSFHPGESCYGHVQSLFLVSSGKCSHLWIT